MSQVHRAVPIEPIELPKKAKKANRVGARAPKPIGECATCPRPFFKEEDKVYVPLTDLVVCRSCSELGKGMAGRAFGMLGGLIQKARSR